MDANTTNVLMIFAVLLSPLIALRVSNYLDEGKEAKQKKLSIFKTLIKLSQLDALNWLTRHLAI